MRGISTNCATQEVQLISDALPVQVDTVSATIPKGIDLEKLKVVLKAKGIISTSSEVE